MIYHVGKKKKLPGSGIFKTDIERGIEGALTFLPLP